MQHQVGAPKRSDRRGAAAQIRGIAQAGRCHWFTPIEDVVRNPAAQDAIVIGSGIGGLAAAAAIAKSGRKVLLLERHYALGGLTQTFSREGFTWATGVHYIGGLQPGARQVDVFGRLLRWLSDGALAFASIGSSYDIVRFPDGFSFAFEAPEAALIARLKATFPADTRAIDRYFHAVHGAQKAMMAYFAMNAMPRPIAAIYRLLNKGGITRWADTTAAVFIARVTANPQLAALLAARWGDHGMPPSRAPFALHALVLGSYFDGAYYPVGGPARLAETLATSIRSDGGELRSNAEVARILVENGRATGVLLADGHEVRARTVISAMGAHNTLERLPREADRSNAELADWRATIEAMKPVASYIALYLGFEGDIRACGATAANVWIYESYDVEHTIWKDPAEGDAPGLFVSFASLKDPTHDPGPRQRHTAEVIVFAQWDIFAAWQGTDPRHRPDEYLALKHSIEGRLLAQFQRHFPDLSGLIRYHELSTPLSQAHFVGAHEGAMYGLEMSRERMHAANLRCATPLPGLYLAGQDAGGPGVQGAFMGGFMAAASIEPRLFARIPELEERLR
jgi:all-trans-retinol 13,14-reductase